MKRMVKVISLILTLILSALFCVSCKNDTALVTFMVDGEVFESLNLQKDEALDLSAPEKEGYDFKGWYLDEGTYSQPFSTSNLVSKGESAVKVYALFTEHVHNYTEAVYYPTCTEGGYTVSICTCGQNSRSDESEPLGHGFLTYVSNGDGTATATCFREGCFATDTIAGDGTSSDSTIELITLSASEKTLELFDSFVLSATHLKGETDFTFVSTDLSVASVTSDGVVTGKGIGNATIKVICGSAVATCDVHVAFLSARPIAYIEGMSQTNDTINIEDDDTFTLRVKVLFKGQVYTNAEAEYSLSNSAIGRVENSVFIPNALTASSAQSTLTANVSWMGYDGTDLPSLIVSVQVLVKKGSTERSAYLTINGAPPRDFGTINLYTTSISDERPNLIDFAIRRVENGTANSSYISITINSSVAKISGDKLVAVGSGTTQVTIKISNWTGDHIDGLTRFTFTVVVN